MVSRNGRINGARSIKRRAEAPAPTYPEYCAVPGCKNLTQRSAGRGLSDVLCKKHGEHLRRHGHESRTSYSKADLTPFRQAAAEWFKQHREEASVEYALSRLETVMWSQARSKDAYHQRGMTPRDKARNVLARLHEAGKTPEQLFLIVLSVKATHAELGPWGAPDWPHVQIARQAKKLRGAAGTHYRDGTYRLPSRYPRGEGLYMRHLGRMIQEAAAYAISRDTIEEVNALRRKQ